LRRLGGMNHPSRMLLALAFVCGVRPLGAQQSVPAFAIGVALGIGPNTTHAGETYFRQAHVPTARFSGQIRVRARGRVNPILHLEYALRGPQGYDLICNVAPNGTCLKEFPSSGGMGAAAGAAVELSQRWATTLLAGAGQYDSRPRAFGELEVAFAASGHVGLTASSRQMTWTQPNVGRLWYHPVFVGFRVQR